MFDVTDLADFTPQIDPGYGRVRVPGVGWVETDFIGARGLPLWPVQSMVVVKTSQGDMARTVRFTVWRSVILAYVRRWGSLTLAPAMALVLIDASSKHHMPWVYVVTVMLLLAFATTWWPFGAVSRSEARRIATAVDLPPHGVDLAHGAISQEQHDAAHAAWLEDRHARTRQASQRYEEGLRTLKARRKARA